jgi:signal transduction histidine kinase
MKPSILQNQIANFIFKESGTNIGILTVNIHMRVLFFNDAFERLYPVTNGEFLETTSRLFQIASLCVQDKKAISEMLFNENIEGKLRYFLVSTYQHKIEEEGGEERLVYTLLLNDVSTMHHQFEVRLYNEERKLIGDMAAGIANLILNPLAVIKGSLQLIQKNLQSTSFPDNPPLAEQIFRHVSLSGIHVERIDQYVQRFLLIGKSVNLESSVVLVTSFLEEYIPTVQREAMKRSLTLICEYPNREASFLVHKAYLKQVLQEIVQNSFEASSTGSCIHIRVEINDTAVIFSVSDFGSGIRNDMISKVRHPFFTTKENSLGLGLTFCDIMIQKMDGTLNIQSSTSETTVSVTLPYITER